MTAGTRGPGRNGHEPFDELAVGWALHALEPEDEAAFGAHLTGCGRCAQTVAETHEVMAAMSADLPAAEPSAALRDRLRAAVAETAQVRPPARQSPVERVAGSPADLAAARHPAGGGRSGGFRDLRPPRLTRLPDPRPAWRRVLPHGLVAAAVAAVLTLGTWNVVLAHDRVVAQTTAAEQAHVLDTLLAPGRVTIAPLSADGKADGKPVATVVARQQQVQVVATGLPVNDTNHTYVVWGMPAGSPVAIGTFDVVSQRIDIRTVGSSTTGLDDYPKYGISLEAGRQPPSLPTHVVATGRVNS